MPLVRLALSLFIICTVCTSCTFHSAKDQPKELPGELQGAWYKRYTGTVAGQPVVVNLSHYGGITTGSFYYTKRGTIIYLAEAEHPEAAYNNYLTEFRTDSIVDDENEACHWALNFSGASASGKWRKGTVAQEYEIDLKEDYAPGSYPMELLVHEDSEQVRKGVTNTQAISNWAFPKPASKMKKDEADLVNNTILHMVGCADGKNIGEFIEAEDKRYFDNYKRLIADMKIDRDKAEKWAYNFYHTREMWTIYNNNSMLVLQLHEYDHSGGGSDHGTYRNSYACVDMQEKKVWTLNDIMEMDASRILPLLDTVARKTFTLGPRDTLSNRLTVSVIPLTDNIFITDSGVTFCYNPGVISGEPDGEIYLFLPYRRLGNLVKDDFRRRMKL